MKAITPEQVDALLPQTQCGLCQYGGCMPYANAMVNGEAALNLCPPGGVKTLEKLGALLQQDVSPLVADMALKTKPKMLAVIREEECIGCTKCIQACPVDAIIGGPKLMHAVITSECTGCELCIPPCPVDCIDLQQYPEIDEDKSAHYRQRYQQRQQRLASEKNDAKTMKLANPAEQKKSYIQLALERAKVKKLG